MCTVQDGVRRAVAPHHRLHHPGHRGLSGEHPRVRRHIQVTVDILSSQVPSFLFQENTKTISLILNDLL